MDRLDFWGPVKSCKTNHLSGAFILSKHTHLHRNGGTKDIAPYIYIYNCKNISIFIKKNLLF
jgi:hypothetical protein